jgi:hypothetical protein
MTPGGPPKKGLLIIAGKPDDKDGPGPLAPPDREPDADDAGEKDTSGDSCATCYAFAPSSGRCQRFPPHSSDWSMVDPTDYCCEFRPGKQHDGAGTSPQGPPMGGMPPGAPQ